MQFLAFHLSMFLYTVKKMASIYFHYMAVGI